MPRVLGLHFTVVSLLISTALFSQYNETISSDRPGQAIGPFTVGQFMFQNQTGFEYGDWNANEESVNYYALESIFRFGLTENFELGAKVRYLQEQSLHTDTGKTRYGVDIFSVHTRYNILVGEDLVPSVALQVELGIPLVSTDYDQDYLHPKITVITAQGLSKKITLVTNWGLAWSGDDVEPRGFYVINLAFSISSPFGAFIEHYADLKGGDWIPRYDGGFYYLINNDLQLDLSGGFFTNNVIDTEYFISSGVSWRIKMKKSNN